jgi:hypothetical protein
MKIFRSLLFLLTLSATGLAETCDLRKVRMGDSQTDNFLLNESQDLLRRGAKPRGSPQESNFMQSMNIPVPEKYSDIFFRGADFKTEVLMRNDETSFNFWSHADLQISQMSQYNISAIAFKELNLQAHEIWHELLTCNGGDAELARKNFFLGQFCPQSEAQQTFENHLKRLSRGFWDFLVTSPLFMQDEMHQLTQDRNSMVESKAREFCSHSHDAILINGKRSDFQTCMKVETEHGIFTDDSGIGYLEARSDLKTYQSNTIFLPVNVNIPQIHPLLAQLMIEIYNISFGSARWGITEFQKANYRWELDLVNELIRTVGDLSLTRGPILNSIQNRNIFNMAKALINNHILFLGLINGAMSDGRGCGALGFWPAMNRMVVDLRGDGFNMSFINDPYTIAYEDQIYNQGHRLCPMDEIPLTQYESRPNVSYAYHGFSVYNQYGILHFLELRRLLKLSPIIENLNLNIFGVPLRGKADAINTPMEDLLCK